jgi:hypothetical protein
VRDKHRRFEIACAQFELPQALCVHELDLALNEAFLCHGTDVATAKKIKCFGYDKQFCKGIYGDGLYFTPDSCKALRYATPEDDRVRTLILARVLVGDPCFTTETLSHERHAPEYY